MQRISIFEKKAMFQIRHIKMEDIPRKLKTNQKKKNEFEQKRIRIQNSSKYKKIPNLPIIFNHFF